MKEILRRARCLLVYLPPYSPQLNPIERCWVAVKCKVRQWLDRGMDLLQAVRQAFVEYIILRVYRYKYKHKKAGHHPTVPNKKAPAGRFSAMLKGLRQRRNSRPPCPLPHRSGDTAQNRGGRRFPVARR
ncbi:transposase [Cardiobacterium hominis]|uniref:transposase n=1 Tax=Cardiobacterium hominis TaxID=2718 RepID=UPI0009E6149D